MKPKPRSQIPLGQRVLESLTDRRLFAKHFQPPESWAAWMTVLRVIFGTPLSAEDRELFERCTGRKALFAGPLEEAWLLCGRRSGKSHILALIAVVLACFRDYRRFTAPGEKPVIMVLACDRAQAQVIFGYARALITETPMLAPLLERETAETLDLSNGVSIEIHTCNYRSVRGRTVVAALCDEIAFWQGEDTRNPGAAVLAALRPAMGTVPGALLLCASSTYDRSGPAFEAFERHHGDDASPVMVWRAPTLLMHPNFDRRKVEAAYAADPLNAAAEYDSEWRTDVAAFLDPDTVDANTVPGRQMLEKARGYRYFAFTDPSGGKHDAFTLAIAHRESRLGKNGQNIVRLVHDLLWIIKPPFDPEIVIRELSELLIEYGLHEVTGDKYAGEFPPSAFRRYGITYNPSELTRSELYLEMLPLLMQRKVELLDIPVLRKQLITLERKTHSGGRDAVDHPKGGADDAANAVAGALWLTSAKEVPMRISDAALDLAASPFADFDWSGSSRKPSSPAKEESISERYERLSRIQETSPLPPPTPPQIVK